MNTHFILVPRVSSLACRRFSSDYFELFVGSGCGPCNLIPVFSPIPLYLVTNAFKGCGFVLVSLILAAWTYLLSTLLFVWIVALSNVQCDSCQIVVPISRRANLPISGKSLKVSIGSGLTGLILTIAASPVLRNRVLLCRCACSRVNF